MGLVILPTCQLQICFRLHEFPQGYSVPLPDSEIETEDKTSRDDNAPIEKGGICFELEIQYSFWVALFPLVHVEAACDVIGLNTSTGRFCTQLLVSWNCTSPR